MSPESQEIQPPPTINVKEAVAVAIEYFKELFQHPFLDLALEEVEKTDEGKYWTVTLGFAMPRSGSPLASITGTQIRSYKAIKVNALTGEPVSMKVRKL